jgi:MoaA/NifB/PqqE/SkfB family radical SAM enzyme
MAVKYYVNLNYVCNERCVFCASDLTHNFRVPGEKPWVTLNDIDRWVGDARPGPGDRVMLAGGEPTLHRELFPIVQLLGGNCGDVTLFTNGLRLSDPGFARDAVRAGITRFEIALFGASADRHDAVTRLPGSFERTLTGLNVLAALRTEADFAIEVRLLVSRQSSPENPDIVRMVHERAPGIDAFSLNRLILSDNARNADATISWVEAHSSINESARLVRTFGYQLVFHSIPLCLFEGDNAVYVSRELDARSARVAAGLEPAGWELRYFDPMVRGGQEAEGVRARLALPDPCLTCEYFDFCGRVEGWYVRRFGTAGLQPIRLQQQRNRTALTHSLK